MSRPMTSGMQTEIAAQRGGLVHFLELTSSGGVTRITTAPQDIDWNGQTWTAVGGRLEWSGIQEGSDSQGYSATLRLSGVDGSIIQEILTNYFRGRRAVIWHGHVDLDAGTVVPDPLEVFRGFLNDAFQVQEQRPESPESEAGGVVVTTRVSSRLVVVQQTRAVRTNLHSHREFLRRAGLITTPADDAMKFVPQLVNKPIHWGTEAPAGTTSGTAKRRGT